MGEISLRNISCCFTGHRKINAQDEENIKARLTEQIKRLIGFGVKRFICGGAIGFDMLAEICILEQKKLYPDIDLVLALPCKSQAKYFNRYERQTYEFIKELADEVIYTSEEYNSQCMKMRNRFMVDNSGYCICYIRKRHGGTYSTQLYARKQGLEVICI